MTFLEKEPPSLKTTCHKKYDGGNGRKVHGRRKKKNKYKERDTRNRNQMKGKRRAEKEEKISLRVIASTDH